ncbi:hypothetical protein [Grimontia sp. AD028]|uniref:hypothetical protein n=1 Tax=Grimontia sp. AD028 TaxID=1581149 RepID=UPI0012E00E0C|nr:hypothetical protein [Grimontia sp. AD028]
MAHNSLNTNSVNAPSVLTQNKVEESEAGASPILMPSSDDNVESITTKAFSDSNSVKSAHSVQESIPNIEVGVGPRSDENYSGVVNDATDLSESVSKEGSPYDTFLEKSKDVEFYKDFYRKHSTFQEETVNPEWQFQSQQAIQDFFAIYVNEKEIMLDGVECKSISCELRLSGPLTSLAPAQAVLDFMRHQTIGFNTLSSIDRANLDEKKRFYVFMIDVSPRS